MQGKQGTDHDRCNHAFSP